MNDNTTLLPDYRDMLLALNSSGAEYLLVGGYALGIHGIVRTTVDIDLWVLASAENAPKVYRALCDFGAPMGDVSIDELSREGIVFQIGVAPCRIDILTAISGVTYCVAAQNAVPTTLDGIPVKVISKVDLIKNKMATGRHKDIADAEELGKLKGVGGK